MTLQLVSGMYYLSSQSDAISVTQEILINKQGINMSIPDTYRLITLYEISDTDPNPIQMDGRFRNTTIVVQPLNISEPVISGDNAKYVKEENAVSSENVSGLVTIKASPSYTYHKYDLPNNVIDLSDPHFISTDTPIHKVYPSFESVVGATHIAVSVISYSS